MKTLLKDSRFGSREDIIQNATAPLHTILKKGFLECIQRWKDRWAGSREDIIQNATAPLHTILKKGFLECIQRWKDRWAKCME
jgi:hypothetical protein